VAVVGGIEKFNEYGYKYAEGWFVGMDTRTRGILFAPSSLSGSGALSSGGKFSRFRRPPRKTGVDSLDLFGNLIVVACSDGNIIAWDWRRISVPVMSRNLGARRTKLGRAYVALDLPSAGFVAGCGNEVGWFQL
jgi:hypothetical protein